MRFRKWAGRAKKYKLRKLWRKKSKRACLAARPWTQKLLDWEPSLKERSQWTMMLAQSEAYSGDVEKAMVTYRQVRNMPHAMQARQRMLHSRQELARRGRVSNIAPLKAH